MKVERGTSQAQATIVMVCLGTIGLIVFALLLVCYKQ